MAKWMLTRPNFARAINWRIFGRNCINANWVEFEFLNFRNQWVVFHEFFMRNFVSPFSAAQQRKCYLLLTIVTNWPQFLLSSIEAQKNCGRTRHDLGKQYFWLFLELRRALFCRNCGNNKVNCYRVVTDFCELSPTHCHSNYCWIELRIVNSLGHSPNCWAIPRDFKS